MLLVVPVEQQVVVEQQVAVGSVFAKVHILSWCMNGHAMLH